MKSKELIKSPKSNNKVREKMKEKKNLGEKEVKNKNKKKCLKHTGILQVHAAGDG